MESILLFSLVLLILVRIVGLGISFELFISKKHRKYLHLSIGWLLSIISGVFAILAGLVTEEYLFNILIVFNGIFIANGILLLFSGILLYFWEIQVKIIALTALALIIFPIILYILFGLSISSAFSIFFFFALLFSFLVSGVVNRINLRNYLGGSYRWFYVLFIVIIFYMVFMVIMIIEGYSYGLYHTDNETVIMINYIFGITINSLLVVNTMIFEYSISALQKFQLKDKYSHDLGNEMQVILSSTSLLSKIEDIDSESAKKKFSLIHKAVDNSKELITEIRKL